MICCPTCNAHFTDNPKLIGQVVTCPKCHLKFVAEIVPTPEASTKDEETKHNGTQQQAAAEVAEQQLQDIRISDELLIFFAHLEK